MWSPWVELAEHPRILVHRCRLREGAGWWCPTDEVILLDDRLDSVTARCVLAHELGHALLRHEACPEYGDSSWLAVRLETAANTWADRRLVSLADLASACKITRGEPMALAAELDVTPEVLRRRLLSLAPTERLALARHTFLRNDVA
ncbi:MAG: ImmA/IrrE family metallo-endopeptidase [Actinomycetota bacterium]